MGLIDVGVKDIVRIACWLFSLPFSSSAFDGKANYWDEEADDLWPGEDDPEEDLPHQIAPTPAEPELVVTPCWGLALPNGDIAWNAWQGFDFSQPLERVRMVASLQKTAIDLGFGTDTEAARGFLEGYSWVTRNQIATVVYEDTGAYPLMASEVSAVGTLPKETAHDPLTPQDDSPDAADPGIAQATDNSGRGFRQGPVGGAS